MTTARAPIAFSLFFSDLFLQQKDQCQNTTLEKEGHVFEAFFLFSRKSNFAGKWARWEGTLSPLLLPILFGSNLPSATTNSFVEIKGRGRARLGQRSFYFQRCFSHLFSPFSPIPSKPPREEEEEEHKRIESWIESASPHPFSAEG